MNDAVLMLAHGFVFMQSFFVEVINELFFSTLLQNLKFVNSESPSISDRLVELPADQSELERLFEVSEGEYFAKASDVEA
eukprot:CAMPEP_0197018708 /NCGR_PEP_ID=MMETSP1380-20130617/80263_1 /TAXON_ID=5936 /ORGANISM="Euplotes crassus, Strain CT5" /LENGTH=79 /DNA_ID=CAMNT_0042445979 /DNA_START=657 /DNA_END=896 /DNA_ORIENTATION=+